MALTLAWAATVDIEATGVAAAGDRALSPSTGVSVLIPGGMSGQVVDDALVITGGEVQAMVAVEQGLTLDQAVANADAGLQLANTVWTPSAAPQRSGATVRLPLQGLGGGAGLAYARVEGAQTVVVVVLGATEAAIADPYAQLTTSLEVTAPKVAQAKSTGDWADELRGRQIRTYGTLCDDPSYGAFLELCSDGRVLASSLTSLHRGQEWGRWAVDGALLTVTWADGTTYSRTLTEGLHGMLMLDGERWERAEPEHCR